MRMQVTWKSGALYPVSSAIPCDLCGGNVGLCSRIHPRVSVVQASFGPGYDGLGK